MGRLPRSTIEQWLVLRTVIEEGGFAQAAAFLHRSQSSVSYAVNRLQEAVGVPLLEIQGRRAALTDKGAVLLADALPLIDELSRLEERAKAIANGEAAHIRLLIDAIFPKTRLFDALKTFSERHPRVDVHLRETVRQTTADARDQDFDLAVLVAEPGARHVLPIADIALLAVAGNEHPLSRLRSPPSRLAMARHVRVEIRGLEMTDDQRTDEGAVWRMSTVEAAIEAVRRGLCYGWLPRHLVETDLLDGRLVPLPLTTGATRHIPLGLCHGGESGLSSRAIADLARLLAAET